MKGASAAASGLRTSPPSHGPGLGDFQIQLLSAMIAQTEAINRLASSNEALTNSVAMLLDEIAGNETETGAMPNTYMDSPSL